jgi:hypothetical protein
MLELMDDGVNWLFVLAAKSDLHSPFTLMTVMMRDATLHTAQRTSNNCCCQGA